MGLLENQECRSRQADLNQVPWRWAMNVETKGRIEHLDSCRGLAATMVVASHCLQALDTGQQYVGVREALGHLPVLFFFLLSGYVLSRSLQRDPPGIASFCRYVLRRFFRLYPALIAVMLLSFGLAKGIDQGLLPLLPVSVWARNLMNWMAQVVTPHQLFQNILLIQRGLDVPTWTIKVEVVCSLLLPLLLWGCRSWGIRLMALLALTLYALPQVQHALLLDRMDLSALVCTKYLYLFFLGAILNAVSVKVFVKPGVAEALCFILLGLLVLMRFGFGRVDDFTAAFMLSLLLLALGQLTDGPLRRLLLEKRVLFLGRISYSVYLVHMPLLCLSLVHLPSWIKQASLETGVVGLFVVVFLMTLLVGSAFYQWVENPFNALGHHLSKKLFPSVERLLDFLTKPA